VQGGLDWTASNNRPRQIVNMSLEQPPSIELATLIADNHAAGNLLVAAAGNDLHNNDPPVIYPARYADVIAVSGTLENDEFAHWITCPAELRPPGQGGSRFGPQVELSAPFWAKSMWTNGRYEVDCGTSMAAPVVSGAAALVWTKNPGWTNEQVRAQLQATARDLGAPGRDPYFGYGRVDAGAAVEIPAPSVVMSGPGWITASGNYQWSAEAFGGIGNYSYEWYRKIDYWWPRGSATCHYETDWQLVGTGQSYSSYVSTMDYDFRLMVKLTSGSESASAAKVVWVGDGTQECPY